MRFPQLMPSVRLVVAQRLIVAVVAMLALALTYPRRHPLVERRGWDPEAFDPHSLLSHVLLAGDRWDATWYMRIAEHGYAADQTAAFFPLYPLLLSPWHHVGISTVLAGTLLSLLFLIGAAVVLHSVVAQLPGAGPRMASPVTVAWLFFPSAAALGAVMPESLLALLVAAGWYYAQRGAMLRWGAVAGLAMLTRPLGVCVLALWLSAPAAARRGWRGAGAIVVAGGLAALWPLYLAIELGSPIAFLEAQGSWNRSVPPAGPLGGLVEAGHAAAEAVTRLAQGSLPMGMDAVATFDAWGHAAQNLLNLAALLFVIMGGVLAWRMWGPGPGLATLIVAVIPLSATASSIPLLSMSRFALSALPAFVAITCAVEQRGWGRAWLVASASTFGMLTAASVQWQWVG